MLSESSPVLGEAFSLVIGMYAPVFDCLPIGAILLDDGLTVRYLNHRATEIVRGGLGPALGRGIVETAAEYYGAERAMGLRAILRRVLDDGVPHAQSHWTLADRLISPENREIDWQALPLVAPDGTRAILMTLVDRGEQARRQHDAVARMRRLEELEIHLQQVNDELQRRVTELNTILDLVPVGIGIAHDPECRVITGNRAMRRMLRADDDQANLSLSSPLTGLDFTIHRDGRPLRPEELPMQVAAATGAVVPPSEMRIVFGDGSSIDEMVAAVPLFDLQGRPRGAVAALVDLDPLKRVEAELRRSQRRLTSAEEVAGSGVFEWDLVSGRTAWSRGHEALFGLPEGGYDGTYRWWTGRIEQAHRERVTSRLRDAVKMRSLFDEEFPIVLPDGARRWLRSTGRVLDQLDGGGPGFVGVSTDITSRKLAEERLALVSETIGLGLWFCDLPFGRLEWNRQVKEHFGLAPDAEIDFACFVSRLHPDDRERTQQAIQDAIDHRTPYDIDYRTVAPDGRVRWIHAVGRAFYNDVGQPRRFDGITIDITDRKRLQDEARQTAERLSAAVSAADTGTFNWDIRTDELVWDANLDRLFGLPPGATARSLTRFIELVHPDDRTAVVALCRRCASEGVDFELEFRVVWLDGTIHWLLDKGRTFRDANGRSAYMTGACVDITARKQAAEALARQAAELLASNQKLAQFASMASHDLREPVRMIASYTQLVGLRYANALDDRGHMYLGFINNAAQRSLRMIEAVLAYSRAEHHQLVRRTFDLSEVMANVLENLRSRIDQTNAEVTVGQMVPVHADPELITLVLQNLIGNALKFIGERRPQVAITAERQPDGRVRIAVADNGIGIADADLGKLFVAFTRLHNQDRYEGSGIGLATCRAIVERHGGTFTVTSTLGSGSTFAFLLPGA